MYKIPPALAGAAYIPGLLYEAALRTRNRLYSSRFLAQSSLPRPVISIGNITMGGTGKTPLVMYVAAMLSGLGFNPAVLTRGYGRRSPEETRIIPPGKSMDSAAEIFGDEPALIRRHVPSAWMGLSKSRFAAGSLIAQKQQNVVFVLDDGFQHRKLRRDLDIVIIDGSHPLGNDYVFPRGSLREPVSGLRRCHIILINGSFGSPRSCLAEALIRNLGAQAEIFHCRQSVQALVPFESWSAAACNSSHSIAPAKIPDLRPAYLVCAIGNPARFRSDMERTGISLTGMRSFADHHRLSRRDWLHCIEQARHTGAASIVITEKDAIKIREAPDFPVRVALQSTEVAEAAAFERILKKAVEEFR